PAQRLGGVGQKLAGQPQAPGPPWGEGRRHLLVGRERRRPAQRRRAAIVARRDRPNRISTAPHFQLIEQGSAAHARSGATTIRARGTGGTRRARRLWGGFRAGSSGRRE